MKKVILSLVFVLATGTGLINANNSEEQITPLIIKKSCFQLAIETQDDLEENGVPQDVANESASLIYDICMIGNE